MPEAIIFSVSGNPLPKQSFRYSSYGNHTDSRIKSWQQVVGYKALEAMNGADRLDGFVEVWITFWRKDYSKVDIDNLSKAVLDAIKGIVFIDDDQVTELHLLKRVSSKNPGCRVRISTAKEQNICEV